MIAIRGATTVDCDCAEQVKECVKQLLEELKLKNALTDGEIICVLFSSTADIKSYYPAKAAREAGFASCALFSSAEPPIEGSLPLCIRVMILAEKQAKPVHVYLHGAKKLRKDITEVYNIALDGPAGSGKSTISKAVAEKLNILCLDTGAMYRACALKCMQSGVDCKDVVGVEKIIDGIDIRVKYSEGVQHTMLDGKDVSADIRRPEISMLASTVSSHVCVRDKMVEMQRKIAAETSCILDGRDIGTNVLPNAEFKFYLTASPEVRAMRRLKENEQKGFKQDFNELLEEIRARDLQDKNRKYAPLKKADDAIEVDTSEMSIEQVVAFIVNKIQEKI